MSAALQEDFQVRQRLAMRRLEEALLCQQRERYVTPTVSGITLEHENGSK